MMKDGITTSMTWNWDGKLQAASAGGSSIALKYTPGFDRIYKESTVGQTTTKSKYIVDPTGDLSLILLEVDPDETDPNECVRKTYVYGNSQLLAQHDGYYGSDICFYLHDRLGSVRQVVDYSGSVVNSYTYDAWGNVHTAETTETVDNPFRFAGYYWDDEISQYFCNARQYEPATYRFTSRDPVCGLYDEPVTLHEYLYCVNNPTNKVDPGGASSDDIMAKAQSHVPSVVKDTLWLYNARNIDVTRSVELGRDLWDMAARLDYVQDLSSAIVHNWRLVRRAADADRCVVEARRDFILDLGKCGMGDIGLSALGELTSAISHAVKDIPGAGAAAGGALAAANVLSTTACGLKAEQDLGERFEACSGKQRSPN
jgi:RHS repeat-associated protein